MKNLVVVVLALMAIPAISQEMSLFNGKDLSG